MMIIQRIRKLIHKYGNKKKISALYHLQLCNISAQKSVRAYLNCQLL